MGEHFEPKPAYFGSLQVGLYLLIRYSLTRDVLSQNRAYAASQLGDLAAKLAKAQSSTSTRAMPNITMPTRSIVDDPAGGLQIGKSKGKEKETNKVEKPKEETPLAKAVKDR